MPIRMIVLIQAIVILFSCERVTTPSEIEDSRAAKQVESAGNQMPDRNGGIDVEHNAISGGKFNALHNYSLDGTTVINQFRALVNVTNLQMTGGITSESYASFVNYVNTNDGYRINYEKVLTGRAENPGRAERISTVPTAEDYNRLVDKYNALLAALQGIKVVK